MSKIYKPNVVRGGKAIPIGRNYYYMKGRKHKDGGIDIGKSEKTGLEVEDGEVMHVGKDSLKVFSSVPFLNGESPAQKVIGGENPNKVFNAQERFKDINNLNDDGTKRSKAKFGIDSKIPESLILLDKNYIDLKHDPKIQEKDKQKSYKRYIGGATNESREQYLNLDKKLISAVSQLSKEYGISPKLMMQRISKEGVIDKAIKNYNKNKGKNINSVVDKQNVNTFKDLGLDWIGELYKNKIVKTNRKIPFQILDATNEKGQNVKSALTLNMYDALELMAADIKNRYREVKNKYPNIENIDEAVNAVYNRGLKGAKEILENGKYKDIYKFDDYINKIDYKNNNTFAIPSSNNVIYKDTDFLPQENESEELYSESRNGNYDYYNPILEIDGKLHPEDYMKKDTYYNKLSKSLQGLPKLKFGGLDRKDDYKSKNNPYPAVNKKDFAGNNRSYPIPTKADAIDALRLASLHHRNDVKTKVYNKYPELKKEFGGKMNKFIETNIFGKRKWITSSPFTGHRKKAELGDEYPFSPVLSEDLKSRIKNNNSTIKELTLDSIVAKRLDNKLENEMQSNKESNDRWRMEYPLLEDTDYISAGINTLGSIGSFISNKRAIDKMKYSSAPIAQQARKLKTKININPQLDKLREDVKEAYKDIDSNTASSRVALARKGRIRAASQLNTNELFGNKENIETELLNKDALNQQQVSARNIENYNRWASGKAAFEAKKQEMLAENKGSLYNNIAKSIDNISSKIDNRLEANRILASELAKNPNVDPRTLRDMGVKAIYRKPKESTKQAKVRQRNERKSNKNK